MLVGLAAVEAADLELDAINDQSGKCTFFFPTMARDGKLALGSIGKCEGPRSGTVELGGLEALSQRDVVRVYADVTGDSWSLEVLLEAELRRRLARPADPFDESLAALMLEAHLGSEVPTAAWRHLFPLTPRSVREFAAAAA